MGSENVSLSESTDARIKGNGDLSLMESQVSRFHKRQSLSIFLAFFILFIVLIIMTGRQYFAAQKHERAMFERAFQEKIVYLNHLLSDVTDSIDGMRIMAEANLMQSRHGSRLNQPFEFDCLKDVLDQGFYTLDGFHFPIEENMIGNLTGIGSIEHRDNDFYRDIHMALNLNPLFRTISESLKNVAWVYYTSKNDFINIYPWVSSADFRFSKEILSHEFYTLGTPERNPNREKFWTQVYVDEYGKGLMTTCAAPIYDNGRFLGTVAIDLTIDFLNTIVKNFAINRGVMCLINDRGQVLAHPDAITSKDQATKTLDEILPLELKPSILLLSRLPDGKFIRMHSFNIYGGHLTQAPLQVLYYEKARPMATSVIDLIGPGPLVVLGMLLILIAIVFVITEKQFILPSKDFVRHIINRSQKRYAPILKESKIPKAWKAWFEIINTVFSENEELTHRILNQNESLDLQVKQRTAELEKEIEERKATEAEKEKLITQLKNTLSEIKILQGFIPICSNCKKIRDDQGYWNQVENYIQQHSKATFSHSMCPECSDKLYGSETWYIKMKKNKEQKSWQ
ncbi:MAG: hypothetical protein A2097_11695 [Desulfobacula sp. GWF2_41_7]|nr:MAG: hypothetical protein A2097_11695 [Desulfobacula sp. GWF2_41_7]